MIKKTMKFIPLLAMLLAVCMLLLPSNVSAKEQSSAEIQKEIDKMKQEQAEMEAALKELEKQQSANRNDMQAIIKEKNIIDQQASLLSGQIININSQISAHSLLIANKQLELENANRSLEVMRKLYKERIRAMEEGGTVSYWSVLFEADSFADLLDRLNMIQEIAEADTTRLEALEKVSREVETAKTILAQEKVTLDLAREEMEKKQVQLAQKQEEASALLLELLAKGQEYEDLVEKSEEAMEEMQEALEAMELKLSEAEKREYEEMLRQQEEEAKKNQTTEERPTYNKGDITWALPCDYNRVSSPFGYRYHPVSGKWSGHTGVDLTPPKGTPWNQQVPIYATRSGVVVYAGWDSGGGGNYVSIDHLDNYKSQYMHLDSMVVKSGDAVIMGQLIGYMGNTGTSTARHLHFVIRHYENYEKTPGKWVWGWRPLNPANFIDFK